jgi:hypothetical protein
MKLKTTESECSFYLAGPDSLLNKVVEAALEAHRIKREWALMEAFCKKTGSKVTLSGVRRIIEGPE